MRASHDLWPLDMGVNTMNKTYISAYLKTPGCINLIAIMFPFASFREKSIPGAGSICKPTVNINQHVIQEHGIKRIIQHKNGDFTVEVNNLGFIKLWRDRSC